MSETPVGKMRSVLLAERAVIEAAEEWHESAEALPGYTKSSRDQIVRLRDATVNLNDAVAKLREVRGK